MKKQTKKSRSQKVRVAADQPAINNMYTLLEDYRGKDFKIGGWFDGKRSYLWFGIGDKGPVLGTLSGQKLYRLARAIVDRFEQAQDTR